MVVECGECGERAEESKAQERFSKTGGAEARQKVFSVPVLAPLTAKKAQVKIKATSKSGQD